MRIFCLLLILISSFLTARSGSADEQKACAESFNSSDDVIACGLLLSPDLLILKATMESAGAQVAAAGQWSNPELSADWLSGKVDGVTSSEANVALGFPIELGGKISARRSLAQSKFAELASQYKEQSARLRSELYLKLHRLRQLDHEREVIEESIATFAKLVDQFGKRPVLSPEQQMTLAVFRMSKNEYEIKRTEVLEEIAGVDSYFHTLIGKSVASITKLIPNGVKVWPEVDRTYRPGLSLASASARASLDAAKASLAVAKSETWPELTVGPNIRMLNQDGKSQQMYGLSFSVPLPVFNTNAAAKVEASGAVATSEAKSTKFLNEEENRRSELLKVYSDAKQVLQASLSHEDIEKRHEEVEALFVKGIVPSALVIEAHRVYVELEQSRNTREMKALAALSEISLIDGKPMELLSK